MKNRSDQDEAHGRCCLREDQIRHRLQEPLDEHQQLYYAGRPGAAAPACGVFKIHLQQQQALVEAALDIETKARKSARPKETKRKPK